MTVDAGGGFSWTNPDMPSAPDPGNRPKHSPLLVVIGLGALLIAGWLVLTVIGGKSSGKLNPIAQAADRTAAIPGARFTIAASGTVPQLPTSLTFHGGGAFNFDDDTGRMTLSGAGPAPYGALRLDFVFTGGSMYMASPQISRFLPAGKSWIGTESSGSGQSSAGENPQMMFQELKAISSQIVTVGKERIRSVQTTHYRATTTQQGAAVPVDVWVDRRGLLRRMQESAPTATAGESVAISVDLYDYGFKPSVVVPPSDQVIAPQDLAQSVGARLSQ